MADINWLPTVISVVGGGAAGAIITLVVTTFRSRKQPIGYRIDIVPIFSKGKIGGDLEADLRLGSIFGGSGEGVPNLYIAEMELVNRGNTDFQTFQMGLTLASKNVAVHCSITSADRHHEAKVLTVIAPGAPVGEVDFQLAPFNRSDVYRLKLYLVVLAETEEPGQITPGSREPVIFTRVPPYSEVLFEALKKAAQSTPFISIGR